MDIPTIEYLKSSCQHTTARHIKKAFPEFFEVVNNIKANSFSEKLYVYFYGKSTCAHCGAPVHYKNFNEGYFQYCGLSCRTLHTRNKAKQTCLERYGDEHYNNRSKSIRTSLERYGVDSWNRVPEKIQKTKNTCIKRYGVPCSFQHKSVKEKFKQTCLERYGVEWYTESPDMIKKSRQTCLKKYGVKSAMQLDEIKNKCRNTCRARYNHPYGPVGMSKKEVALATWIESHGFEIKPNYTTNDITEIDIYIPGLNIGIEFNDIYWHSNKHKHKNYHINKTRMCYKHGIKLYHIWEHWDQLDVYEFILHILGVQTSLKNFDEIFYRDKKSIHIDIHPELCEHDITLKRRMFSSYVYFDSGVIKYD